MRSRSARAELQVETKQTKRAVLGSQYLREVNFDQREELRQGTKHEKENVLI